MKSTHPNRISMQTSKIFPAALLLLGVFILVISACGKKEEQVKKEIIRPVKTMTVGAGADLSGLSFPGRVRASQRVELAFKEIGGRLIELPIEGREGQEVKKDELLARIDPKDFETQLRNVQGRLREAEAALELAKKEYARVKRIQAQDPGAVSAADIDRKLETVNSTEGRIKSLRAEVENAKNLLSYTYLRAPFPGLIARRFVDNFQDVKPKQPILSLEDVSSIELLVDLPENVMAIAREASTRIETKAAFPTAPEQTFSLDLKEFATRADPATQTYQVVFQMPQPEGVNILPGMTATVTISIEDRSPEGEGVRIPAIAVVAEPDGSSFVWVVDGDPMMVSKNPVKAGEIIGSTDIKILEGLEGGETIVVAGVTKLRQGMQVRLWEQQ